MSGAMQPGELGSHLPWAQFKGGRVPLDGRDIAVSARLLRERGEAYWHTAGARKALALFHEAAKRVPAYRDFLAKHRVNAASISTIDDFQRVPVTDKRNYIAAYPLPDRCWNGSLRSSRMMAVSSGTSGEATYWPRSICQDVEAATTHELVFRYLFDIDKISTLIVVCFPMGVYVSGMATVLPTWLMANGRYNVTCVTVGNNQAESLRAVKHLQREYQQLILIGHPFFIKDVIETGIQVGINWAARSLRLMFCSGSFSEEWRQYVMRKGHIRNAESVISTYGCSEMLLIGHETPLSIFVRNTALRPSRSRELLQRDDIMPSLFQYNPVLRFIETVGQELVFTSASGTPLIRFNLHDRGEVLPFRKVTAAVSRDVPLWKTEVRSLWRLPFVTLYGRTDYTVKFYGANIYPEHIHMALHQKNLLRSLTGKFVMMKRCQPNLDELLEIHVELRSGMAPEAKLTGQIQEEVVRQLMLVNREYSDTLQHHVGRDLRPRITLWRYQKEPHFRPGLKPHYIGSSTKGR